MEVNGQRTIAIVGCGPGSIAYLTPAARKVLEGAEVLAASAALHERFPALKARRIVITRHVNTALEEIAAASGERRVVAVSGDPGISSFARLVIERFGREGCRVLPGISAVQASFAALGLDWTRSYIVNAHARTPEESVSFAEHFDTIAILGGGREGIRWIRSFMRAARNRYRLWACENVTLPDERIRELSRESLATADVASLTVFVLAGTRVAQ